MTDLERCRGALEIYRFLVHVWRAEGRACTCEECKELVDRAEELLKREAE